MKDFIVYAHRGASEYCPENTLLSFYTGVYMGANGIETDVQRTKDGTLVLFHDSTIMRMMGIDKKLADCTYEELSEIAMEKCGRRDYIVTLEDFLACFSRFDLTFAIELKGPGVEAETAELIYEYGVENKVVATSFQYEYLLNFKKAAPDIPLGYLALDGWIDDELLARMKADGIGEICPRATDVTPEAVEKWHSLGFNVRAWGVANYELMRRVYDAGADGTTVNFPDKLIEYIASKG